MSTQRIGRYEIEHELGRGGMAIVYLARDPLIKRQVAVKALPRQFTFDPQFRARFQREAEAIATLEHPAIVPVYDFGEHDEQPFIVMRYMPGGSLLNRLALGPLSLPNTAQIVGRVADALDEAHARRIVHRDIKPGNVLFDGRGEAFLSDFGIAKILEHTGPQSGTGLIGTPEYISPEQARGVKDIDGRSDVYSLGVMVFQALTGQLPFDADTPMGMVVAHLTEPAPSILSVKPDLPPACDRIISRALSKEPVDRYPTAGELSRDLDRLAVAWREGPATEIELPPPPLPKTEPAPRRGTPPPAPVEPPPPVFVPPPTSPAPVPVTEFPGPAEARRWARGARTLLGLGAIVLVTVCLVGGVGIFLMSGIVPNLAAMLTPPSATVQPSATDDLPGTQTAQAQEAAQTEAVHAAQTAQVAATRTAASRRTATARAQQAASATARARAALIQTATAQQYFIATARAGDRLVFGPRSGSLPHEADDGTIEVYEANVSLRDFWVAATFFNPYSTSTGSWDYGFLFRYEGGNDQFRLSIHSDATWKLANRVGDQSSRIGEGNIANLDTSASGSIEVGLICRGDIGLFYVNGIIVADLDLSARTNYGSVLVATGMYSGDEIVGETTRYEDFTIWSVP